YRSNPNNYTDIEAFYDKLPHVLDNMNVEYGIVDRWADIDTTNSIELRWHDRGNAKNTWYIKSGYLPNYFYFDKTGYSGWGSLVHDYDCDIDYAIANEFIDSFMFDSRMPQAEEATDIDKPYVLVLGQKWLDAVLPFSYFGKNLHSMVVDLYSDSEYNVIFKPHPLNPEEKGNRGNLHKLVDGAKAVYTMNSGSGFEALFQGKRVFTTGVCDYHWATTQLKTMKDFRNSIQLLDEPVDTNRINKFLYYCMTEYFMNINDTNSIQKKIHQAIAQAY
ncbi:MAG: polysialyltransferase family glycosyltransferase, partial [Nitrosomonadaceae bacterium]